MGEGRGPENSAIALDDIGSLFDRFARRAFRYARMMGISEADADDVVADSFLKVLYTRETFRGESELSTWLLRIVRNTTLNLLRSVERRKARLELVAKRRESKLAGDSPEKELERGEMAEGLQKALQKLPAEQRSALSLVTTSGLSYREAAEVEGISEGALASRIYRAREALRRYLAQTGVLEAE